MPKSSRSPGIPGARAARAARSIVASWFRELGLDVEEEEFSYDIRPAFRAIRAVACTSALLVGGAGWVARRSPGAALIVLLLGLLVGGTVLVWAPGAESIYRAEGPTRTANITARRPTPRPRKTIVLMAHYDSKSQNLTFPWRNGAVAIAIFATLALLAFLAAAALSSRLVPVWIGPALGSAAAACLLLLATLSSGNESPGGVDNAGSVAVVRELARCLPSRVPEGVELIFLLTSAEEDHMIGAMRWLDRHRDAFHGRSVYALNFDGAGAPGCPVAIESYGIFHRFAPEIARVAVDAARDLGLDLRRIWLPPAVGIDAIPFHHRGLPCLTFSSGSLGRATMSVHSSRDVAGHPDPAALAECARLGAEVAARLAIR